MKSLIGRLSEDHLAPRTVRTFRWALYVFLLFNTLVLSLPIIVELYGFSLPVRFPRTLSYDLSMSLHRHQGMQLVLMMYGLQIIGILLYFNKRLTTLSALLVFVSTALIFNRFILVNTGGNYLINLMLFFLVFVNENVSPRSKLGEERILISNLFFWACRIQVLMVYLLSGVYKLAGESWRNGTAVQIITHIEEFSTPFFKTHLANKLWLMKLANYVTLIYLCGFPILVWFKKVKNYLLLFGILYHLGLGLAVGVMDFSLVMIICYILFMDEQFLVKKVGAVLPSKERSVAHPA
jgi:hypothetical protein